MCMCMAKPIFFNFLSLYIRFHLMSRKGLPTSAMYKNIFSSQAGMTAHAFSLSSQEAEAGGDLCDFKVNLVYIVSSSPARGT